VPCDHQLTVRHSHQSGGQSGNAVGVTPRVNVTTNENFEKHSIILHTHRPIFASAHSCHLHIEHELNTYSESGKHLCMLMEPQQRHLFSFTSDSCFTYNACSYSSLHDAGTSLPIEPIEFCSFRQPPSDHPAGRCAHRLAQGAIGATDSNLCISLTMIRQHQNFKRTLEALNPKRPRFRRPSPWRPQ
jgi:hypothetical protein